MRGIFWGKVTGDEQVNAIAHNLPREYEWEAPLVIEFAQTM